MSSFVTELQLLPCRKRFNSHSRLLWEKLWPKLKFRSRVSPVSSALFVFWLIMAVLDKLIHEQKTFVTVDPYISRLSCQSSFCSEKGWSSLVEFSILELQRLWNTNSNVCSPEEEAAWAIKQEQGQSSLHRVPVLTDITNNKEVMKYLPLPGDRFAKKGNDKNIKIVVIFFSCL